MIKSKVRNPNYICTDCDVTFQLITWPKDDVRTKYCPMCGDSVAVKAFRVKGEQAAWTDEEIEWIDKYMTGEVSNYLIAKKFNRTISQIEARVWRRKKELGLLGSKAPEWTDKEKAWAEQCLNGKMTKEELSEKTGRSYEAVRAFVSRMRVKRRKQNENDIERAN